MIFVISPKLANKELPTERPLPIFEAMLIPIDEASEIEELGVEKQVEAPA